MPCLRLTRRMGHCRSTAFLERLDGAIVRSLFIGKAGKQILAKWRSK